MKVFPHLDSLVLERALLRQVTASCPAGDLARVLIVVPTTRLASHVQRRLGAERGAWVGLEVTHFKSLSLAILRNAGVPAARRASRRLLKVLVREIVRDRSECPWAGFVRRRPRALDPLVGSLNELRESGIEPGELEGCITSDPRGRSLAQLYAIYSDRLHSLARSGWYDDAGLARAAAPHAAAYAESFATVFVYGAYELIGTHLALLREMERSAEVRAFWPMEPGAPACRYAEQYARRHLLSDGQPFEPLDANEADGSGLALRALYDEERHPDPAPAQRFAFRHAQGAAAEVKSAVRQALQAIRAGCPPGEIVIAARGLTPYAAALEQVLDDEGLAWTSPMCTPLRRQPVIHDLMLALHALVRDFPRRAAAELLRSPRIDWRSLLNGETPPPGDLAERWSRRAGIVGGLHEWTDQLQSWSEDTIPRHGRDEDRHAGAEQRERRREAVGRIGRCLHALYDSVQPRRPRTWAEHADTLERLIATLFAADENEGTRPALESLRGLLAEMRSIDTIVGAGGPVAFETMYDWLEEAVDGAELTPHAEDSGGIRVLDAMQARGITCSRLFLLGLNSGQFPHPARQDPILTDPMRRNIRERTGHPVPAKSEGVYEERLLLTMLLGAARDRVEVSWQRADESGRTRTPSLALREIARLALGRPDLARLRDGAVHLPSHPAHWLEELERDPGLLSPEDERLLTALRGRGPEAPLESRYPELAPGMKMLRATEAFSPVDTAYDGRIGARSAELRTPSVSAFEKLGYCPLLFFFQRVLGVRELDEAVSVLEISKMEMGSRVHTVLERLYGRLLDEDLFRADRAEALRQRAAELLEPAWEEAMETVRQRMARRVPVLWEILRERWVEAIRAFVDLDLARIAENRWTLIALEQDLEGEIDLDRGVAVRLSARFDRRLDDGGRGVIGDYKTGGIADRADITAMLKGTALQVPLYSLLAGGGARVELLGVGPTHDPPGARESFGSFESDEQRDAFLETVRTLKQLIDRGCYPLYSVHGCSRCAYQLACRRTHPPTLHREAHSADGADYSLLRDKNKSKKPTLAAVRRERERGTG